MFESDETIFSMDNLSKARRSKIMSRIRGRGNKRTELEVMALFRLSGIKGWRRHLAIRFKSEQPFKSKAFDGTKFKPQVRPDFIFPKSKVVLFIDGCFWHGCPKCYRRPKSRGLFWAAKVRRNKERDRFQMLALKRDNWRVLRIWEHDLAKRGKASARRIRLAVNNSPT